jgi:hypothetical protein
LSQIFTKPVAKGYRQEMERWLRENFEDELVEMQPPVYNESYTETKEEVAIANRRVMEWITAYVPSPGPETSLLDPGDREDRVSFFRGPGNLRTREQHDWEELDDEAGRALHIASAVPLSILGQ